MNGAEPELPPDAFDHELESDAWLERVREAEAPCALGRIGPYELLEEVSRGGQGVVFRALQPHTHRTIALKRLLAGTLASRTMTLRFEREVEAAAALSHPGIVTAYGMEVVDGAPLFAMEWIDGLPVDKWARGCDGGRDPQSRIEMFLRICDAVQHAHSRGVLHRDLKPSNILVDANDQPHVLDFGLAKRFAVEERELEGREDADLTADSDFIGTPAYAAPEQLRAEWDELDARADVYSLGVILYEVLTGESPYPRTNSPTELVRAVETLEPPRPSSLDPRLDRQVDLITRNALAKSRDERYPSVAAFAEDLRRHLAGQPLSAVEPSSWYLLRKLVLRNRLAFSFAATVLVMLIGFALYAERQTRLIADQRDEAIDARELAEGAADRMERLLQDLTDRLARDGALVRSPLIGNAGGNEALDCPVELQGTPNPAFDLDEFQRRAAGREELELPEPPALPGT